MKGVGREGKKTREGKGKKGGKGEGGEGEKERGREWMEGRERAVPYFWITMLASLV